MNTGEGLIAAIVANPDDDTARLAYADFLDEQPAGVRKCPICGGYKTLLGAGPDRSNPKCGNCDGTGRVRDESNALFAEFIRLQCKIAEEFSDFRPENRVISLLDMFLDPDDSEDQRWKHYMRGLGGREAELIRLLPGDVFGKVPWNNSGGHDTFHPHTSHPLDFDWKIRRGFLEEITLPAGMFWGEVCASCRGHGRHADHSETECTACGGKTGTGQCGTGRTGGYAGELFRKFPIRRVSLSGMAPWKAYGRDEWGWWEDTPGNTDGLDPDVRRSTVAPAAFYPMWAKGQRHEDATGRRLTWDAKEMAQSAFDTALLEYGRTEAAK